MSPIKPPFYWVELFRCAPGLMSTHIATMRLLNIRNQYAVSGTWGSLGGLWWIKTAE